MAVVTSIVYEFDILLLAGLSPQDRVIVLDEAFILIAVFCLGLFVISWPIFPFDKSLRVLMTDRDLHCVDMTLARLKRRRNAGLSFLGDQTAQKGKTSPEIGR